MQFCFSSKSILFYFLFLLLENETKILIDECYFYTAWDIGSDGSSEPGENLRT